MKIKYSDETFIRHKDNKSLLWNKHNSACYIFSDAKVFLSSIDFEWQDIMSIAEELSNRYCISVDEIKEDFEEFIRMLQANQFIETDFWEISNVNASNDFVQEADDNNNAWTPLGDFFSEFNIPSELHIDLTSACTERCVHCYIPEYNNTFLDFEVVKKVLEEYREIGGLHVHLTGGECMMHPKFAEIVQYCKKLNLNIVIMSNLTLCDASMVSLLKEINPWFVNVSLYSMNPVQHDAITTIKGSWKKTMSAILELENTGVACRIAAPVLKENMYGYGALKEFASQHKMNLIPDVDILPQADMDSSNIDRHALSPSELKIFLTEHKQLCMKEYPATNPARDEKVCDISKGRLYMNSLGNYYPCVGMFGYVLGNARDKKLSEIWYGKEMDYLRKLTNKSFGECADCSSRRFCKVCPANNFNATGNIFKHSKIVCAYSKVKEEIYGG